jgi:hypothetical protein
MPVTTQESVAGRKMSARTQRQPGGSVAISSAMQKGRKTASGTEARSSRLLMTTLPKSALCRSVR